MKHGKFLLKLAAFALLAILMLAGLTRLLEPKFFDGNYEIPGTSTCRQFYDMEEDSVDVLFLGSSACVNAFCPQVLYDEYGIRSYNLGNSEQSVFFSYYWLREALETQTPKAVVLETRYLFEIHEDSPVNMPESMCRRALDPMRASAVKAEAVTALCALDPGQDAMSYWFTNLRFHDRWKDLREEDFYRAVYDDGRMKGWSAVLEAAEEDYEPFVPQDPDVRREMQPVMREYLDRMAALCRERGIELILVTVPTHTMDDGIANTLAAYSAENGLTWYNFAQKDLYDRLALQFPAEHCLLHANVYGSRKLSRLMGELLVQEYGIEAREDDQWAQTAPRYREILQRAQLALITDPAEYLTALRAPDYAVLAFGSGDVSQVLSEGARQALAALGIRTDLSACAGRSFYAAVTPAGVEEASAETVLEHSGTFFGARGPYTVKSGGTAGESAVTADGRTFSAEAPGLHVLVYDLSWNKVIDAVRIDAEGLHR